MRKAWLVLAVLAGCAGAARAPSVVGYQCFRDTAPPPRKWTAPRSVCSRSAAACTMARASAMRANKDGVLDACAARTAAFCFVDKGEDTHCAMTEEDCEGWRKGMDITLLACQEQR